MIDIGLSVSGSLNFPNSQEVAGAIRRGMQKIALTVANQATQNADGRPGPNIVTGRLRSSITGRVISPRSVQVGPFTRTANAPAYPFLRPAVEYAQRIHAIDDILQREIDKAVNGA